MTDPRYPELYERDEARRNRQGVLGLVVGIVTALILPIRYTGKLLLVRELQKYGVDTAAIPEACLRELADETVSFCKAAAMWRRRGNWRSMIVEDIETTAIGVSMRLCGEIDDCLYDGILRKHRVLPTATEDS